MATRLKVCHNCCQLRLYREGQWPCEVCGEPAKLADGTQLKWHGTIAEVSEHQRVHDVGEVCKICNLDPSTRIAA